MIIFVTWCSFGMIAGCLAAWGRFESPSLPPTLITPSLSRKASRRCISLWSGSREPFFRRFNSSGYVCLCKSLIMRRSASSRSSTVERPLDLSLLIRRRIRATALTARDQDENPDSRSARESCSVVSVLSVWAPFTSGSPSGSSEITSSERPISLSHKNAGPWNQSDDISSLMVRPLEAWSAGFWSVGTYLHCCWDVLRCIFWMRLATNVWKRRASLLIYPITTLESVQKYSLASAYPSSSFNTLLVFTEMTAAVSSNLGIVVTFVGATRDFAMIRAQWMSPSSFLSLRYEHCP